MPSAVILLFIYTLGYYGCFGNLVIHDLSSNRTEAIFVDAEALFGSRISPFAPISGFIFPGAPLNGCVTPLPQPVNGSSSQIPFIALVVRGQCVFSKKAMAAQMGNFTAVVVYNNEDDSIFAMSAASEDLVRIPAVMVGLSDGTKLMKLYSYSASEKYMITITANKDISIISFLIPLVCFVGLIFLCTIVYCCCRCYVHSQQRRRRCLTRAQLNTIPVITFNEGETSDSTCPICLEEFANQDQLRLLPCHHVYHRACVDHWLLRGRRVCPVCKRPTHGRRRRRRQRQCEGDGRSGRPVGAPVGRDDEAGNADTGDSELDDDETDTVRSQRQEAANASAGEGQPGANPQPSGLMEVSETTPLLAGSGGAQSLSGRRWMWLKARRKSLVAGWLNSNPFPPQHNGQQPQSSTSSRAPESLQVNDTVGVLVTPSDDASPPQVGSTSRGFNTVQAIVHQTASPTENASLV